MPKEGKDYIMEEKSKKIEPSVQTKRKKAKIAVITLSTILVMFFGLQVYASTNGYGNVFFMIRNLITTGNPAGNDEIFSDRDITLSYKSIELADGLKIQANRLEIKDGKTKLYLSVKSNDEKYLPLKYEVSTKNNEQIETTTKITGTKPENSSNDSYEDILTLNYEIDDTKIIVLKISDSSDKELRTLEINLQTREITVKGEKEFEKISQIELKKYLDLFSELNNGAEKSDVLVHIAQKIENNYDSFMEKEDYDEAKKYFTDRAFKNAIIKEFYGENAEFEYKKQANTNNPDVEVLKGITGWEFDKANDAYKPLTSGEEYKNGHCLKIEDISYENDIYTVKYIYLLATNDDERAERLEELPQYETTIKLKRDNDQLYSKYQIVSIEKGNEIKEKVSTNDDMEETNITNDNIKEDNVTNYITSMAWGRYEATDDGLSFEYPTEFTLVKSPDRGVVVEMTGDAIGKDVDTGKAIKSRLKIRMYVTESVGSEEVKKFSKNWTGYTTKRGDRWYNNYIDGYNTPGSSGYQKIENYVNFEEIGNGMYLRRMIEFETDNRNNYKVTNIINKIIGSTIITNLPYDYTYDNTNNTENTTYSREELMDTNNWVEYWPDVGMKFKLPKNFEQGQVNEEKGIISVNMSGWIVLPILHYEREQDPKYEGVPVRIELYNEIHDNNINMWDVFENSEDRVIKSTDNRNWSDWYPLKDDSVPTIVPNGYIRRSYGRIRGDMVEKVIFDMQTEHGMDTTHYSFIRNVLETVSSTSR